MLSDPMAPIAGVSLEKYAELVVMTRAASHDRNAAAAIVAAHGVNRAAWERAMIGWENRLTADTTPGRVTAAYYKHYREALARATQTPATATFDAYVEMSAQIRTDTTEPSRRPTDVEAMCEAYNITSDKWAQISQSWTAKLMHDPQLFALYSARLQERVRELDWAFLARS